MQIKPEQEVQRLIKEYSRPKEEQLVINFEAIKALSERTGYPLRSLEIFSLEIGVWPLRYLRNYSTYSSDEQINILGSRCALFGLGGGWAVICLRNWSGLGLVLFMELIKMYLKKAT